jgi:hypothetical protein
MLNFSLIVFGWLIFRSPNLQWLLNSLMDPIYGRSQESLVTGSVILVLTSFYAAPMVINHWLRRLPSAHSTVKAVAYAVALVLLLIFLPLGGVQAQEFIYFNF